jgi:hypothetical protein
MSIRGATIDGVFAPTAGPSNNREAATANAAIQDATKDIWRIGEPGPKQSGFLSCIAAGTEDKRGACLNAREQFITNDSLFGSFDTDPSGFGLASVNAFAGLRIPNLVRPPVGHDTAIVPPIVIAPQGILDRNASIAEDAATVVLAFQDTTFETAASLCG